MRVLHLDAHLAAELLRAAQALEQLPGLSREFQAGTLSWSKIREVTRHALPADEDAWLSIARDNTAEQIQRMVALSPRRWENLKARPQGPGSGSPPDRNAPPQPSNGMPDRGAEASAGTHEQPQQPGTEASAGTHEQPPQPGTEASAGTHEQSPQPGPEASAGKDEQPPQLGAPTGGPEASGDPEVGGEGSDPRPSGVPGGAKHVQVTFRLTPDQYQLYRQSEARIRSRLQKRVPRERVLEDTNRLIMGTSRGARAWSRGRQPAQASTAGILGAVRRGAQSRRAPRSAQDRAPQSLPL